MSLNINVVSFNIGSVHDWQNLASRQYLLEVQETSSLFAKMEPAIANNPEDKSVFESKLKEADEKVKEIFAEKQKEKIFNTLYAIIDQFQPAVFCLQEYFPFIGHDEKSPRYNYEFFKQILKAKGYELVEHKKDLAIAYHVKDYDLISAKIMTLPTDQYHTYELPLNRKDEAKVFVHPAMYMDVKHKETGVIVRFVTDHIEGFNGKGRKKETEARKQEKGYKKLTLADSHTERLQQFAEKLQECDNPEKNPFKGDYALEKSLQAVTSQSIPVREFKDLSTIEKIRIKLLSLLNRIFKGEWGVEPDVVIYGLDANTTAKVASTNPRNRLHPKRMRLFDQHGFKYTNNPNPTIIDANDYEKRKYDYVAAKALSSRDQIDVADHLFDTINDPSLLHQPSKIMSDHLPVLATITYTQKPTLFSRLRPK